MATKCKKPIHNRYLYLALLNPNKILIYLYALICNIMSNLLCNMSHILRQISIFSISIRNMLSERVTVLVERLADNHIFVGTRCIDPFTRGITCVSQTFAKSTFWWNKEGTIFVRVFYFVSFFLNIRVKHICVKNIGVKNIGVKHIGVKNIGVKHIGVKNIRVKHIGVKNIRVKHIGIKNIRIKNIGVKNGSSNTLAFVTGISTMLAPTVRLTPDPV